MAARKSAGRFKGHAVVFNERTTIGDPADFGFHEQVHPLAFEDTLRDKPDVKFLFDHSSAMLLARTGNGSLKLSRDAKGLVADAAVADTTVGRDVITLTKGGDLAGMSFGFVIRNDRWEKLPNGEALRTILDVELHEVSAVTFPAYPQTTASSPAERGSAEWAANQRVLLDARKRLYKLKDKGGR